MLICFGVSVSERTGVRRLHIAGQRWYRAVKVEVLSDLAAASYNARCGVCWKAAVGAAAMKSLEVQPEDTGSSVATDDESSSSVDS